MFNFIKYYIYFLLSKLYFKFLIIYHIPSIQNIITNFKKKVNVQKNIGLLLAAGTSTRFCHNIPKQLYKLNNDKPIIYYSIDLLISKCEQVIIVTNSLCIDEIKNIIFEFFLNDIKKIHIICNDINCRLESIEKGLIFIDKNFSKNIWNWNNILIHDSARPFVPKQYIVNMTEQSNLYSQYCIKLSNGLMDLKKSIVVDRDNYIELCTPILVDFDLYLFIFMNFISKKNRFVYEPIDILKLYKIPINICYGHNKFLRKITWFADVE